LADTTPNRPFDDDVVQPFQIDASQLRGRFVRLGGALDDILTKHDYPAPIARLLGETITLAVTLAGMLKYEGIFTLQTKGDGPIRLMVADVTSAGDLRGYAQYDADRLPPGFLEGTVVVDRPVPELLGKGYLAFTVDQGDHTDRYQGIVELVGDTLTDSVQHYFRQSEQLDTGIRFAIDRREDGWRSGALMIQRLPEEGGTGRPGTDVEDDWRRAMVLMTSATTAEMTDPGLGANDLLLRLFHEDGVRVWPPGSLRQACRCSRERVATVLASLPREEVETLKVDGKVTATCEFCNSSYAFDDADVDALHRRH
jgi:molecular chaperone Hsp33